MPVYEYKCRKCGKKSDFLIRSVNEKILCECGSTDLERLISAFAISGSGSNSSSCSDGSCNLPPSPCSSGMCGL